MAKCKFIFDFGSPNAYLAHQRVKAISARTGIKFEYGLALLGGIFKATNNQPPMIAFGGVPNKMNYLQKEMERFVKKYQITKFKFNSHFPINTLQIMRGGLAAVQLDCFDEYIETCLSGMWEKSLKMDDPETIARLLSDEGLDAEALMSKAQTDEIKKELIKNTENAVENGVFGIPSFFIDGELFFGKETLSDIESLLSK